MAKICLIGAGSTAFAQTILGDVLSNPEPADICPGALATSHGKYQSAYQ